MIKKRLIHLLSHAKKYVVYQVIWQIVALLCQVLIVYSIASLIEESFFKTITSSDVIRNVIFIGIGVILRFVSERLATFAAYKATVDVKRILRGKIYEKLLSLGASYRRNIKTSEVVQLSVEGVEQLEIYFGRYLPQFFYSMIAPFILFVILSFVNFNASIVLLICVPLIPLTIMFIQKIAKRLLSKYWGIYTQLGDSFLENLHGLTTLKIYQADKRKSDEMDVEAERFRTITMKVLTMQLNSISVMDIVAFGGAAVGIVIALTQFFAGNVTLAGVIMLVLLAAEFFIPMRLLGSFFHIAMNGMAASDKIFKLMDIKEEEKGENEVIDKDLSISIENLSYSYPTSENEEKRQVLNNVNLLFAAGSFTSIVGSSGCGKSTIAKILSSKNKGYEGSVKVNALELSSIKEESLMKNITVITHEAYLFEGSVKDNLIMAKEDASDEELYEALRKVNLYDFVMSQDGLNTKILDKGTNLSGGQRQRLAIARSLLHNSPIYIFDEATSNIDVESEEMIMNVIHTLTKENKTIILISHRLANVVSSDVIYILENGNVVGVGNHKELLETNEEYKNLFNKQKELEEYGKGDK